jgi:hypothetical protein
MFVGGPKSVGFAVVRRMNPIANKFSSRVSLLSRVCEFHFGVCTNREQILFANKAVAVTP